MKVIDKICWILLGGLVILCVAATSFPPNNTFPISGITTPGVIHTNNMSINAVFGSTIYMAGAATHSNNVTIDQAHSLTVNSLLSASGEVRFNTTRIAGNNGIQYTWSSDATDANTGIDTGLKRSASGVVKVTDGSTGQGGINASNVVVAEPNGELWTSGASTELLTLATGATTTDTTGNLLPANSVIEAVTTRVTTTITTAVSFSVGDPTTAARFSASAGGVASTSTRVGVDHWSGAVTTLAAGPSQAAAAKVRITCNANPGAGIIRITVFYKTFTPPTQ